MSKWLEEHGWTWHDVAYHAKSAFAVLLSIGILVGGGLFVFNKASDAWNEMRQAEDYLGEGTNPVAVTIPPDTTLSGIADILVDAGVIRSAKAFDKAVAVNERAKSVQSGKYNLKTHMSASAALDALLDPANRVKLKVTVIEGLTLKQQLAVLSRPKDKGGTGIPLEEFEKVVKNPKALGLPAYAKGCEGYLFPDTYDFADAPNATAVLKKMVDGFKTVANQTNLVALAKEREKSPSEIMTIASIIEGESRRDEDRGKVARVIYNRLDDDMILQMDSTVHYAVGKSGKVTTTDEDRKNPSPYNTYVHKGLPPSPINAPSKKAMIAALNPTEGKWMYFVLLNPKTGETLFAETYEEQKANEARWKACQADQSKC